MFESKSQHDQGRLRKGTSCYEYLKNNVWKQITTLPAQALVSSSLLRISKEQCLKANHNSIAPEMYEAIVVTNI